MVNDASCGLAMAGTSGGGGPPHFDPNDRTLPAWLDTDGDHGVVIVLQMKTTVEGKPLPKNPFTVSKSVQQNAGKISSAYNENRGMTMVLKVRNEKQAQQLKKMTKLIDGTDIVVTDHPTLNQTRVVVSCSRVIGMSEADLTEELKDQGVIGVRKFTRMVNGTRTETASMVLTIQGTVRPEYIYFGYQRCEARLYVPSPMLCYNCYEYGHSKTKCGNATVCRHCSTSHETTTDAEGRQSCQKAAFCKNCEGRHGPGSKECPKFKQEAEIARLRTEKKISFAEAKQLVTANPATTSYSNTVSQNSKQIDPRTRVQESEIVMTLRRELAEVKKALSKASETQAAAQELAETKKLLEEMRRENTELRRNQNNSSDENEVLTPNLTKNQRKALKKLKQKTETAKKDKENHSPEPKKPKNNNTPNEVQAEKAVQYYKLNKTSLIDDPIKLRRSRSVNNNNRSERSVSRSPV